MNHTVRFITFVVIALLGTASTDAAFLINHSSRTTIIPAFDHHQQQQQKPWHHRVSRIVKRSDGSPSISMTAANGEAGSGGSHFKDAGKSFVSAADAAGSQDYACPHLLKDIGESLQEIGEAWSTSWEAVTYSAYDAAGFFTSLSQLQKRQKLAKAYAAAAGDFSKMSAISGCVSVGPPSSAPILDSLSQHLKEAADAVSEESDGECKDSVALRRLLRGASVSIRALASEYD